MSVISRALPMPNDELDRVVTRLIERRPDIKLVILGGLMPVGSDQA